MINLLFREEIRPVSIYYIKNNKIENRFSIIKVCMISILFPLKSQGYLRGDLRGRRLAYSKERENAGMVHMLTTDCEET